LFANTISLGVFTKDLGLVFSLIFAFFGLSGILLFSLALNAFDILIKLFLGKKACPGVAPLIPGVKIPGVPVFVPIHGWISLLIILLIHEGFHGITARKEKIKVKSAGMLFLGLLPVGAFIDPDEKQLEKASDFKKLNIFSAGPSSNLFSIIIFLIIAILLFKVVLTPVINEITTIKSSALDKIIISKVSKEIEFCGEIYESPAAKVLDENMQLLEINDKSVTSLNEALQIISENKFKELKLSVLDKEKNIKTITIKPNELGIYGFTLEEKTKADFKFPEDFALKTTIIYFLQDFFNWLIILSFLVGIVNFLPMNPFDGGRIAIILLSPYFSFLKMTKKETEKFISRILLWIILGLLIINALPLLI